MSGTATSDGRTRSLRRGMAAGLFYRVSTLLSPLLLVPLALTALGSETYAVWMIAVGITTLFAWADLGLGNTLMSRVGALQVDANSTGEIRRLVGVCYIALGTISIAMVGILAALVFTGAWGPLLGVDDPSTLDSVVFATVTACFLLNVPASLIHRLLFGLQRVSTSYFAQSIGPLLSLALAAVVLLTEAPAVMFVLAATIGPLLLNVALSIKVFVGSELRDVRPIWVKPTLADLNALFSQGLTFLAIGVTMALANAFDALVLPHFVSLETVSDYTILWRLFAQVGAVLSLLTLPLWPTAADALARGDLPWLQTTLRKMQRMNCAVIATFTIGALTFGPAIIDFWLRQDFEADRVVIAGFCVWWGLQAFTYPLFMVQNAALRIRAQLLMWVACFVLAAGSKFALLAGGGDHQWLPWIASAAYAATLLPCAIIVARSIMSSGRQPSAASVNH